MLDEIPDKVLILRTFWNDSSVYWTKLLVYCIYYYSSIMSHLTSVNPYTQEVNGTIDKQTAQQVIARIEHAEIAFKSWKQTSFEERKQLFLKMADDIDARNEELAKLETIEM
jgi:acyl-CoA reductase-like NAD-dependent aldehyde dehydrogenase